MLKIADPFLKSVLEMMDGKTMRAVAEQGDVEAQYLLGTMYATGYGDDLWREDDPDNDALPKKDLADVEAVKWFRKAAEQGHAVAQNTLAASYYDGRGVEKDRRTALVWSHKAAAQGLASAQYNLGLAHFEGEGVLQDFVEAHMWLNLAAAQSYNDSATLRDEVASKMSAAQIEKSQSLARQWQSTHQDQ